MPFIQIVTKLPYTTGLPRDVAETTWNFDGTADLETIMEQAFSRVESFWTEVTDIIQTIAVSAYISALVDRPNCSMTAYAVSGYGTTAGFVPITTIPLVMAPASGDPDIGMPQEVAICCSELATNDGALINLPERQRRSRQYIGPFTTLAMSGVAGAGRPSSTVITDIALSALRIADRQGEEDVFWVTWSRAGEATLPIDRGFVDNEWDTQRRRGLDATSRESWSSPIAPPP